MPQRGVHCSGRQRWCGVKNWRFISPKAAVWRPTKCRRCCHCPSLAMRMRPAPVSARHSPSCTDLSVGRSGPQISIFRLADLQGPKAVGVRFNVGETCSVHKDACFGLVEHTFNDDAAAVLFKPTPLDPGLCSEASVLTDTLSVMLCRVLNSG